MIKKIIPIAVVFILNSYLAIGQIKFTIDGTKFNYPIVERWISEYTKENHQAEIKLAPKGSELSNIDIQIVSQNLDKGRLKENQEVVYVSEYALLPVTSQSNKYLKTIKKDGLTKKQIKELFFEDELIDKTTEKPKCPVTIYARESQSSSAQTYANYFGFKSSQIQGKKIAGDDVYLISAIKKDTSGITFNTPGNIYDLKSRKVKEGLALLPIDIGKENYSGIVANLDETLVLLESNKFETIPVEKVGFVYRSKGDNGEILKFITWVLTKGQNFNHEYGFLNLDKESLTKQQENLAELFLSAK